MKQTKRKIISICMTLIMSLSILAAPALAADAGTDYLPDSLYLTESASGTCTLLSAAMMLRSRLYLDGNDAWTDASEQAVAGAAWSSAGLGWNFAFTAGGETLTVSHMDLAGVTAEELTEWLYECPEGIVLYCGWLPHAVFLTDCTDGVFWCVDPAYGTRMTLADSYLGSYGDQEAILRNVTACWYIANAEY